MMMANTCVRMLIEEMTKPMKIHYYKSRKDRPTDCTYCELIERFSDGPARRTQKEKYDGVLFS